MALVPGQAIVQKGLKRLLVVIAARSCLVSVAPVGCARRCSALPHVAGARPMSDRPDRPDRPDHPDRPDPKAVRYDVAIAGGGIAGMATAARLQARGCSTIVFEAHGQPGGCAGFYRRNGFAFDVGATTLVDFAPGGVGGELLQSIGMPPLDAEELPGY